MPTKLVNLNGTLNLQDDEFTVGLDGFTELINLRQENGKLIRRKGTGALYAQSSKEISDMKVFVHRRLHAVSIDSSSSNYTFSASAKTLTISADTGVTIGGGASRDWRDVFKAGDTIYINSLDADNDSIFTIASITSTVMTFENAPTNEGPISSGTITFGFSFADFDDNAPSHITAADANSFDGRAWITSYTNTNKFLSLVIFARIESSSKGSSAANKIASISFSSSVISLGNEIILFFFNFFIFFVLYKFYQIILTV